MGKRDIKGRETKKPKKDTKKKVAPMSVITPTNPVEVIKKERKRKDEDDD